MATMLQDGLSVILRCDNRVTMHIENYDECSAFHRTIVMTVRGALVRWSHAPSSRCTETRFGARVPRRLRWTLRSQRSQNPRIISNTRVDHAALIARH